MHLHEADAGRDLRSAPENDISQSSSREENRSEREGHSLETEIVLPKRTNLPVRG